ncbi:BamA/TamA family outer membrane protein [bacterium]|nr:BamA/TamA family outer membrane protein [bacterium]
MMFHLHVRFVFVAAICATLLAIPCVDAAAFGDATFGPITVEGNTATRTDLILHELGFAEGDPFDFALLDASWEHLEDLGWFAFVDLDYDDGDDGRVPVTVIVEEDRTTRWYPVIDYDPRWEVLLGARIYDINFRGRGEALSLTATWYRRHGYELTWRHPWLFGVSGLSCGLGGVWEDADFEYRDFGFTRWEAGGWVRWDFASPLFMETGASLGAFDQQGADDGLPDPWPAAKRGRTVVRGTLGLDSRDIVWYPTRGQYHRITCARIESDDFASYDAFTGDLRGFVPLPWDHVLALRAWGRRTDGHVPPEDVLHWGGAETIRGHEYASREGEEGFLLSVEYRWPLFLMTISGDGRVIGIGLHAFGDAGSNWWDGDRRGTLYGYGGGAHINISDHQFRFELAFTGEGEAVFQFMDAFNF